MVPRGIARLGWGAGVALRVAILAQPTTGPESLDPRCFPWRRRVALTDGFFERLDAIQAFLKEADAGAAYDALLDEMRAGRVKTLREYLLGDDLILCAMEESAIDLLSIRHRRQLAEGFARLGPGSSSPGGR